MRRFIGVQSRNPPGQAGEGVHDAALFIVSLFVATWLWSWLSAPLLASGDLRSFLVGIMPGVWAPTLIALALTAYRSGPAGVTNELRTRLSIDYRALLWSLLGVLLVLASWVAALTVARATGAAAAFLPTGAMPVAFGLQVITGAVGEELGWRGFLLPRLNQRLATPLAVALMGVLWSLWHVPAFFTPGMPQQMMPMLPFLVFVAVFGLLLGVVFCRAGGSVVPAMLTHLALNITLAAGGVQLSSVWFWVALAVPFALFAGVSAASAIRQSAGP
jgi:uncharacterized protein